MKLRREGLTGKQIVDFHRIIDFCNLTLWKGHDPGCAMLVGCNGNRGEDGLWTIETKFHFSATPMHMAGSHLIYNRCDFNAVDFGVEVKT